MHCNVMQNSIGLLQVELIRNTAHCNVMHIVSTGGK